MPIKMTKEYSLFSPGKLVVAAKDLHSTDDAPYLIELGSLGLILRGPNSRRSGEYLVQFLTNVNWWVRGEEIKPYLGEKKESLLP